jgi:hypothetical protein
VCTENFTKPINTKCTVTSCKLGGSYSYHSVFKVKGNFKQKPNTILWPRRRVIYYNIIFTCSDIWIMKILKPMHDSTSIVCFSSFVFFSSFLPSFVPFPNKQTIYFCQQTVAETWHSNFLRVTGARHGVCGEGGHHSSTYLMVRFPRARFVGLQQPQQ